jgi:1-acyl-sn-glycerol-3-phosphate acyltransferase
VIGSPTSLEPPTSADDASGAAAVSVADPAAPAANGAPGETGTARPKRARPLPARMRVSEVAANHRDTREGIDWLGHPPEARAGLVYRLTNLLGRSIAFGLFRFKADIQGRDRLPVGGRYIVIAAAHRGWMDPLLVLHAQPIEPRGWFLGGAAAAFSARWKELALRHIGGVLPVWRGGIRIDHHVRSAAAVLEGGGVFIQMPEGTVSGPAGKVGTFRLGAAIIILRTGAPIVPIAVAGTDELYLGKRMAARILPPTTAAELLGEAWPGVAPEPGTRAELDLAHALTDRLQALLSPHVVELHAATVDPPGHRKRWRDRLTWLLLARGPLDRSDPDAEPASTSTPAPGAPSGT